MAQCLVTFLPDAVTASNSSLRKIGETQFLIPKCKGIVVSSIASVTYTAINGTAFEDQTTVKTGTSVILKAPADSDVIVSANNKYAIKGFYKGDLSTSELEVAFLDARMFDYYFSTDDSQTLNISTNGLAINANHRPFGYFEKLKQFGGSGVAVTLRDFDWESEYNGLDSKNLPGLTTFGVVPDRDVNIKSLGKLTGVSLFPLRPSGYWKGEIRDLCDALISNGKTDDFSILTNANLTLDGVGIAYNKTVTCTYSSGAYVCVVS